MKTNEVKENQIVVFNEDSLSLEMNISPKVDTVWLTLNQISDLFERDKSNKFRHIKNVLNDEHDKDSVVAKFATTATYSKTYQMDFIILT